jgi:hypothetical protein
MKKMLKQERISQDVQYHISINEYKEEAITEVASNVSRKFASALTNRINIFRSVPSKSNRTKLNRIKKANAFFRDALDRAAVRMNELK